MKRNFDAVIDTNILVRFLVNDNKSQVDKIEKVFISAKNNSLLLCDLVLAETVFVLQAVYDMTKQEIIDDLAIIIEFPKFLLNYELQKKVLSLWQNNNISYVDAYCLAMAHKQDNAKLYTFDKNLIRASGVKAFIL